MIKYIYDIIISYVDIYDISFKSLTDDDIYNIMLEYI